MTVSLPLPAEPGELTSAWLTAALRASGALARGAVAAVDRAIIGEERGFTGVVARLRPRYAGADPAAPASLIAKLPTAARGAPSAYREAQERDPAAARQHYERCAREVAFYRELAPRGPAPAPRLYYGAADDATGRVALLLEDVGDARPGDALRGCSPEEALRVVEAIAPFHARWWARPLSDLFPWLPWRDTEHQARQERYARQVAPFLARHGARLPPAVRDLVERLGSRYAAVLAALDRAPATVVHADLHLDNVLFPPPGAAPPAVVLDWQGVAIGAAATDVAAFVCGALDVAERRATEDEIVRRYHALLLEHGVAGYPLARLRDDCRLALLRQLAGVVGWLAAADPARLAGRERALIEAALGDGRLMAALLDHDAAAVLPG
ncbi:MAG TPA: aminoglycoside phosphotransferase family protein [Thermomicrobiales bacterium]|nr:aminoglycoside phosphotransferase family protein [Thermomicrobiales bacterium]